MDYHGAGVVSFVARTPMNHAIQFVRMLRVAAVKGAEE